MAINIGDKNKIKNSNVVDGNSNHINTTKNSSILKTIIISVVATLIAGIILLIIEYNINFVGIFS